MYDRLVDRDPKTYKPTPMLATSWKVVNDTTWEFTLRTGREVPQRRALQRPRPSRPPWTTSRIRRTRRTTPRAGPGEGGPDRQRLHGALHHREAVARAHRPHSRQRDFLPMPPKALKEQGVQALAAKPIGTGPFKFVAVGAGREACGRAQEPDYWQGAAELKPRDIPLHPRVQRAAGCALAGEIDIMKDVPPHTVEMLDKSGKAKVRSTVSSRINYLALVNLKPGPMQDMRVRQAIAPRHQRGRADPAGAAGPGDQDVRAAVAHQRGLFAQGPVPQVRLQHGRRPCSRKRPISIRPGSPLTLDTPSGRYPLDKDISLAIAAQLSASASRSTWWSTSGARTSTRSRTARPATCSSSAGGPPSTRRAPSSSSSRRSRRTRPTATTRPSTPRSPGRHHRGSQEAAGGVGGDAADGARRGAVGLPLAAARPLRRGQLDRVAAPRRREGVDVRRQDREAIAEARVSLTVLTNAFLIDCTGKEPVDGAAVVVEGERIKDVIRSGKVGPLPGQGGDARSRRAHPHARPHRRPRARVRRGGQHRRAAPPAPAQPHRGQGAPAHGAGAHAGLHDRARRGRRRLRLPRGRRRAASTRGRACSSPAACSRRRAGTATSGAAPSGPSPSTAASAWWGSSPTGPTRCARPSREQLRHDVDQIKIMASGGAMSPGDELDTTQYTVEEMRAAVEEARAVGKYVLAHAYSRLRGARRRSRPACAASSTAT